MRIEIKMKRNAKTISQRCGQQPGPSRRADQGKLFKTYLLCAGDYSLADHQIKLVILHGRIELFFNRWIEAMYLIDEQDVAFLKVRQLSDQVARNLD